MYNVGECFIFDDSFEHEVFNPPSANGVLPRVVLIIDIWHPDLTNEEVLISCTHNNQCIVEL